MASRRKGESLEAFNARRRATYQANPEKYRAPARQRAARRNVLSIADTGQTEYQTKRKPREQRRAEREGYRDPTQARRLARLYPDPVARAAALEREVLASFNLSRARLDDIRLENMEHAYPYGVDRNIALEDVETKFGARKALNVSMAMAAVDIQTYNLDIDSVLDTGISHDAVGYAVSYHAAVVNTKTNYPALKSSKKTQSGKEGNPSQWWYLVHYSKIYDASTYDERYGARSRSAGETQSYPRP